MPKLNIMSISCKMERQRARWRDREQDGEIKSKMERQIDKEQDGEIKSKMER